MTLMLHVGAQPTDYDGLRALTMPPATATHVPIPHFRVVDMLKHTLAFYGHEVVDEHYGVTEDGMRFFGLLSLRSSYGGYEDTVALRNSHDKKFPVGIGFGGRVFCCDNLSFIADHIIRRKHTANAKRDLPGLVGELVEPLALQREEQHRAFLRYQDTALGEEQANDAIMTMFRQGVINVQRIAEVLEQWEHPTYLEWGDRTAWRLFNAATFALNGRVVENSELTPKLHKIIDGVCVHREAVDGETGLMKYALADFSVELRPRGWYFGRQYDPTSKYRGPYKSIASVTLMIARQLRREVERRDGAASGRASARPIDETAPPF